MKFNVGDLKKGFSLLKPGFNPNDLSESGKYLFISGSDFFAYNGRLKIKYSMPIISDLDTLALPVLEFGKLLNKLKGEMDIVIENDIIIIQSGSTKAEFPMNKIILEKMNVISETIPDSWSALPENIFDGLRLCLFSVGKDFLRPTSNIMMDADTIASTDNFRLSLYKIQKSLRDEMMLLPFDCVENLLKYAVTEYQIVNDIVYFRTSEGLILSFKFLSGIKYPDVKKYASTFKATDGFELFPEMSELIDITSIVSEKMSLTDRFIDVEANDGKLDITGSGDVGRIKTSLYSEALKGKTFSFQINPIFFMDVIKIKPIMKTERNMAVFEKDNFLHVFQIKPLEIKKPLRKEEEPDVSGVNLEE